MLYHITIVVAQLGLKQYRICRDGCLVGDRNVPLWLRVRSGSTGFLTLKGETGKFFFFFQEKKKEVLLRFNFVPLSVPDEKLRKEKVELIL